MPANLQAQWARLLLGSVADAGVRDVIVSPGSRSTPFVLAAAQHPRLSTFDVIDERAAAFFALGRARVTGRPALVLCTSGTAAANYLPAVVEAGMAHVPLLVLTADRPVELVDCGANQTIDQLKLYGAHARRFVDLGVADAAPRALRALRRATAQAVFTAHHPEPGAVHLNARAGKPLEPQPATTAAGRRLAERVDELLAQPLVKPSPPRRFPAEHDVEELAALCRSSERGLVVCGPAAVTQASERPLLARLGELTGFPVYCEPASQGRFRGGAESRQAGVFVDALDALLHSATFRRRQSPELILQLGRCPTSGAWKRYLEEHLGCAHWVIAPHGWHDHTSSATRLLSADIGSSLELLETQLVQTGARPHESVATRSVATRSVATRSVATRSVATRSAWSSAFARAEKAAWQAVAAELDGDDLSEGTVAHNLVSALPAGALLALGNSLPIRAADTYCRGDLADVAVWSQRGASGIDGVVSGAAGAASAWGGPTALLVGDVSFLHDLSGLAAARRAERPFVIVVVNNRGGRIFEQLPLAADPAARGEVFDHWLTPHDFDLAHAAALYRLPHERAESCEGFEQALARALERPGASVVEAVVPPHGAAEQNRRLWRHVDDACTRD